MVKCDIYVNKSIVGTWDGIKKLKSRNVFGASSTEVTAWYLHEKTRAETIAKW